MSDPDQAEQIVVSMLDLLGIGLYQPDGTSIRVGTETRDGDFFLFEPEARGLVYMLRHREDADESISFRDFHAALAGLGFSGTAEDLARAYSESYAAEPNAPVSQLVASLTGVDVETPLPTFAAWLLVLDGFIPPNGAATAVAYAGPGYGRVAAGLAGWGTARSRVQTVSPNLSANQARLIGRLTAVSQSWHIAVNPSTIAAHEGHGGPGSPVGFDAHPVVQAEPFVDPITGTVAVPVDNGGGGTEIFVQWTVDSAALRHGVNGPLSVPSPRMSLHTASHATFTPKQEDANGQGTPKAEVGCIHALVRRADLLTAVYGAWVAPYAALAGGFVDGDICIQLTWHEKPTAVIKITWTDSYDGVRDTIVFEGDLTEIQPRCDAIFVDNGPCSIDGATAYRGTGTATGDKAGWAACNPGIDLIPNGSGKAWFTGVMHDGKIVIGAYADLGTPMEGIVAGPFEVPLQSGTLTTVTVKLDRTPTRGEVCPTWSEGEISVTTLNLP